MARLRTKPFKSNFNEDLKEQTQKVFLLRKSGNIPEAYQLAQQLYCQHSNDEWVKKALAWVLVSKISNALDCNLNIEPDFQQLQSLNLVDDLIIAQIKKIQSRANPFSGQIDQANTLSKNGQHQQALALFNQIQQQGGLNDKANCEKFGWAIYRYISKENINISENEVKHLLWQYLNLDTPKPSMLHSFILQSAIAFNKSHNDFNLMIFLQYWNLSFLSNEDFQDKSENSHTYPSLAKRLIRRLAENSQIIDLQWIDSNIKPPYFSHFSTVDFFREQIFWQLINFDKNNDKQALWRTFDNYVNNYSFKGSLWHSKILDLAERKMIENNEWRFKEFLQAWGVENFVADDWIEKIDGEYKNPPLVKKVLKKFTESLGNKKINGEYSWIQPLFKQAMVKFKDDVWLKRNYATFLKLSGKFDEATKLYKEILLELNDQYYAWHELALLLMDKEPDLAISMLCMAISKQKNEDFLGDIHLDLAHLLTQKGEYSKAKRELNIYETHRQEKGWRLSERFNTISQLTSSVEPEAFDQNYYQNNNTMAIDYLYQDIPWQDFLVYNAFKNQDNKEMLAINNLKDIDAIVSKRKFHELKNVKVNDIIQCKIHFDTAKKRQNVILVQVNNINIQSMLDKAPSQIVVIDNINKSKNLFHYYGSKDFDGVVHFNQIDFEVKVGDLLKINYFSRLNQKTNRKVTETLKIAKTIIPSCQLVKETHGEIELKYKHQGKTFNYEEASEISEINLDLPDFGFINDCYVPKYLLSQHQINSNREITVKALNNGKWQVFEIVEN